MLVKSLAAFAYPKTVVSTFCIDLLAPSPYHAASIMRSSDDELSRAQYGHHLRIYGLRVRGQVHQSSFSASTTRVGDGMARFVATESRTWVAGAYDSAASVKEVYFAGSLRFGPMVDVCSLIR